MSRKFKIDDIVYIKYGALGMKARVTGFAPVEAVAIELVPSGHRRFVLPDQIKLKASKTWKQIVASERKVRP